MTKQEQVNQSVYEGSSEFLTDAQRQELKAYQDNRLKSQQLWAQMRRNAEAAGAGGGVAP